jgi:CAAX protease family protein
VVVTGLAGLVVLAFIVLAVRLHLAGSRLDAIEDPARALALIVERTMDLEDAMERVAGWERRLYELTVSDGRSEIDHAIVWYEEMADAEPNDVEVQGRLAILYGESERVEDVTAFVERWRARAQAAWADVLEAAYLDAPPPTDAAELRATVDALLPAGWFRDRVALRLADRANDTAWRTDVVAGAQRRTAPLLRRVRALTAAEAFTLLAGALALIVMARRRALRVAFGLIPPPWRLAEGVVVLIRGAGAGVLVMLLLIGAARLRPADDPWLSGVGLPLMYVPLLLLARARLFAPAGVGLLNGLGWRPSAGGWWALVRATALLVGLGTLADLSLGLLAEASGTPSHWTEWFDEDLAYGSPAVAAASLFGTVVAAPVLEEIVFRGLLFATLRRRLAWPVAAVISAAIFAAAHGYGAAGFGSVFISGLLWAVAYEKTGSVLPGTAAHVANNVAAAAGVLLLLRG